MPSQPKESRLTCRYWAGIDVSERLCRNGDDRAKRSDFRRLAGQINVVIHVLGGYTVKVAIYVRESGTRKYKPASLRAMYPANVTFCLRYTLGGKRRWEQLSASNI